MELLTEFHERVTRIVFDHRGTLEKYIGDAVMATFGTPSRGVDDAGRALHCAWQLADEMYRWSRERARRGCAPVHLGIDMRASQRCVIGHPFNPPHVIPLVEVVGGAQTAPAAIQQAMSFYTSIGKKAIHLRKEVPGHVANRLQAALYREVLYLIEQGVLSVADADDAVSWGPGLRWGVMGPSLQFHLGGGTGGMQHFIEHLLPVMSSGLWKALGNPTITPELQRTLIEGVLQEAGTRSVEQLAQEEHECWSGS